MFKKIMTVMTILVLVSTVFISCASGPKEQKPLKKGTVVVGMEGVEQPEWVNKPPKSNDVFYAVGYAKLASKQRSTTAADQNARDQVSRWVGTSVKNALTNYYNESGEGSNVQALSYFEDISKQVSDQVVVGVERDDLWVDAENGVYVLTSFPKANVGKGMTDTVEKFARNDAAAFSEFKAKEALSFLDKETSKEVSK